MSKMIKASRLTGLAGLPHLDMEFRTQGQGDTNATIIIARSIIRGVQANFSPENQQAELERIVELFQDLAMSCKMTDELSHHIGNPTARRDADVLGQLATWIEDDTQQILGS